jgi:hypothetical protein
VCIKYSRKGYYIKEYGNTMQRKPLGFKSKGILKNEDWIKGIRECLIKYFAFYYNSACAVYKNAKYSIGWWLQKLALNYI